MKNLAKDFSLSAVVAGLIVVLVGMTSSAVLVFQAAQAAGVDAASASSWLGALCLGQGLLSVFLSIRSRTPIMMAWSTPGAALIAGGLNGMTLPELTGAFVFSAALILLCGLTGMFDRLVARIPVPLSAALLAGVLLHFALETFAFFPGQPMLIGLMFLAYVAGKKFWPRGTMVLALGVGALVAATLGQLHFENFHVAATRWTFTAPALSLSALLGVGVPLFIVTMASQNLTGMTVMRAYGYQTPVSPLLTWAGAVNLVTAVFGGFTINLAAITAAIGMGPECHPQPEKRYVAAVVSGAIYIVIGLFAATVTSLFAAFPKEMVIAVAGLALLATISSSLLRAVENESEREAAFVTFVVTASGVSFCAIGSAFWGLALGAFVLFVMKPRKASVA